MVKMHNAQKVVHTRRALWPDKKKEKLATVIVGHFSLEKLQLKTGQMPCLGH